LATTVSSWIGPAVRVVKQIRERSLGCHVTPLADCATTMGLRDS